MRWVRDRGCSGGVEGDEVAEVRHAQKKQQLLPEGGALIFRSKALGREI